MVYMVNKDIKIVAFVGLPGSGKSKAVEYVAAKGYPKVYFGGIILNAMNEYGLEHTEENERKFREDIREREGKDFVVKQIIKQIHDLLDAGQHRIVADGLYSWTEYKAMKHEFPGELSVFATVSKKHLRHHRLANRLVRPLTSPEADEREWSEIENLEIGGPIATADYYIINNGTVEDMYQQIDTALNDIEFYS